MNIITWNMQGATGSGESKWNTDVKRLFLQLGVNVACLQECGNPPSSAIPTAAPAWLPGFAPPVGLNGAYLLWNLGTSSRPFNVYIVWIETDPNGHRNNLAVASILPPSNLIYIQPGLPGGRPALGMRLLYGPGNVDIFTLHAFSGSGNDAPGLIANINATGGLWFAAGDYNRDPTSWTGVILPGGTVYCAHNVVATHPGTGTNLDYGFKNPGPAVVGVVGNNFVVSDHFPVSYQI
ncbi:MAG: endonuclease/exonuclease/phosphatase family protein [Nostoc sp.]|uniref:endonuclease/exonuclease/phosphatase family protein n=1 Tax=Nostoc sp. TaxID=1180 RepID=UPI002FF82601